MIRINLAPVEVRRRRPGISFSLPAFNLGVLFGALALGAVVCMGLYWGSLKAYEAKLTMDFERGTRENESLKATLGAGADVKPRLADIKKRVQVIEELLKGQERPIVMLDAFVDTLPSDLWITGLEERSSQLKLRGSAFSTTAVADFMTNLKKSGRFKDIEIVVSRQELGKVPSLVTFEVTCRFEG